MPPQNKTPEYQQVIEDILEAMDRSDVAVDHVSVASEGILSAALVRGLRTRRIVLPVERLVDRAQVRAALETAIADLTPRRPDRDAPSAAVPETRFRPTGL
jgi:hypothetical protein